MIPASARGVWAEVEKHLRPFVARRLDDPADASDVLQEIHLRVLAGMADLRDSERFGPWIYRVARSALADHGRSRARHQPGAVRRKAPPDEATQAPPSEEEVDAERELARHLTSFVAALAAPYRQALVLTELQEMNHQDAAQMLGISLTALKARVRRGRQQIHRMLQACCDVTLDVRGHVLSFECRPGGVIPDGCCVDTQRTGATLCDPEAPGPRPARRGPAE